ncbi:AMP-binding protein [Rhodoblastus acidophilus]|uniref:AMP-binding protein n=1 Tax=Candidatus Rhodoblastus alkanivorans TaxID=2954117 RepID=A0ABS9Z7S5_9HYPH|nr:AMP-binding protein [Candidatus Rhodoblastus alkanivorans]MCI4680810.1 AMP-binding protein [Candidatus Rhodoblastus alkanivorans]MCI4683652.1 AMP-binding protein [Candidatus Rhodoblastus alkanivorans]MDI4640968.1 AMP-binding protein [Rhodoblastus acidophilus]
MNIANWLYQTAMSRPERDAILVGAELRHNYASLLQAICARAAELSERYRVAKGDRVAIFAKNCPEYIELLHACWWIGAVAVPVNCKLHPSEAEWILRHAGATLVYTDGGGVFGPSEYFREAAIAARTETGADVVRPIALEDGELAWLFYTSGTTGKPKGAMLSHGNLRNMALCYTADVDNASAADAVLYAAPMSHGAGLYMFAHLRAGGAHLVPPSRGFDCDEIIDLAITRGDLVFFAAPTMVKRLIAASRLRGFDGAGIRTIIYGGGPMYLADLEEALELFGPRFVQIYGQGETPMTIAALSRDLIADADECRSHRRRASVGVAQSCVEIAIVDGDGNALPPGRTGEICVKSPTVMLGYWRDDRATAETIRDGWLHTGDLGHISGDGFIYLTDRSKDVIISGGTNIYPREVEEALLAHPAVFEVAVVGEPESEWGEQVVAHIVLAPDERASEEELDNWCRQRMAAFKRPKKYVFVVELPKNSYGKILKTALRANAPAG